MSEEIDAFNRLMREARGHSDSDVALLQEAARIADCHGDAGLGIKARIKMIQAAQWSGNYELTLVTFAWCLAQIDRNEQLRIEWERKVLWYYKWAIETLCEYSQVSLQQIDQSFADMADRYQRAGYAMSAVHKCRAYVTIRTGDMNGHRIARNLWQDSPRDSLSDCPACEVDSAVAFDLEVANIEAALSTAVPIIEGRLKCRSIPSRTFGRLLLPLLKLSSSDQAEHFHRQGLRQASSSRNYLTSLGEHCAYLAIRGDCSKAIKHFETGISWVMIAKAAWDRMEFLQNAMVLFERLAGAGDQPIQLKVPESAPFHREDHLYAPSGIAQALQEMHAQIVDDLNRRNGNVYASQRHERFREMFASISGPSSREK